MRPPAVLREFRFPEYTSWQSGRQRNVAFMAAGAEQANRTILFVNWAHALDHFVLLIFPTAVIAAAADFHRDYSGLISLSTGAFVAFGLFALPTGWLAGRFGRRALLACFFFGCGAACLLAGASASVPMLAVSLFLLGTFSAIYHPIGSAMIVANAERLGRALGVNGVWGNMGAALASGVTATLAAAFGWRAAFFAPGAVLLASGVAFVALVKEGASESKKAAAIHKLNASRKHLIAILIAFMTAILAGGLTFNIVTIAMPKIIDERFGSPLPLSGTGSLTTAIFVCGALTQILVGRLIDRVELIALFIWLSVLQPVGLLLAARSAGLPLAIGLMLVTAAIYGQIVVNDAMVGRYVPAEYRNRVYSIRFFLTFTVGGFAVPLIGALHGRGGFPSVLMVSGVIGVVIFTMALTIWLLTRGRLESAAVPAE
jgi:MFS family permease